MTEQELVFINNHTPARSREAVRGLWRSGIGTVACSAIAWRLFAQNYPETSVPGCIVMIIGIISAVSTIAQLQRYLSNQDEDVIVSDRGVTSDSKFWDWAQVRQVDLVRRQRVVFIHVNNGPMRSRLSLLIRVPGEDAESVMQDLRTFVANKGITVRERGA